MTKKLAIFSTIISVVSLMIYMYVFWYGGIALDEMMSYEMFFEKHMVRLWSLLFLIFILTVTTIINLILQFKKPKNK